MDKGEGERQGREGKKSRIDKSEEKGREESTRREEWTREREKGRRERTRREKRTRKREKDCIRQEQEKNQGLVYQESYFENMC